MSVWDEVNSITIAMFGHGLVEHFDLFFAVQAGWCCIKCKSQFVWIGSPVCNCVRPIQEPFTYR